MFVIKYDSVSRTKMVCEDHKKSYADMIQMIFHKNDIRVSSKMIKESTHAGGQPDVTLSVCGFGCKCTVCVWGGGVIRYTAKDTEITKFNARLCSTVNGVLTNTF